MDEFMIEGPLVVTTAPSSPSPSMKSFTTSPLPLPATLRPLQSPDLPQNENLFLPPPQSSDSPVERLPDSPKSPLTYVISRSLPCSPTPRRRSIANLENILDAEAYIRNESPRNDSGSSRSSSPLSVFPSVIINPKSRTSTDLRDQPSPFAAVGSPNKITAPSLIIQDQTKLRFPSDRAESYESTSSSSTPISQSPSSLSSSTGSVVSAASRHEDDTISNRETSNPGRLNDSNDTASSMPNPFNNTNSPTDAHLQGMVARFNALDISDPLERKLRLELALKRSEVAREAAESELHKLRSERSMYENELRTLRLNVINYRRQRDETNEREQRIMKQFDDLMKNQGQCQTGFKNEIRRLRKEAFKSSSVVVKLQEENKEAKKTLKVIQAQLDDERKAVLRFKEEAFAAQYELVGKDEKLNQAMGRIKLLENEITCLQSNKNDDTKSECDEGSKSSTGVVEKNVEAKTKSVVGGATEMEAGGKINGENEARLINVIKTLLKKLELEKRIREKAEDLVDFMKMECEFGCCGCRLHDDIELRPGQHKCEECSRKELRSIRLKSKPGMDSTQGSLDRSGNERSVLAPPTGDIKTETNYSNVDISTYREKEAPRAKTLKLPNPLPEQLVTLWNRGDQQAPSLAIRSGVNASWGMGSHYTEPVRSKSPPPTSSRVMGSGIKTPHRTTGSIKTSTCVTDRISLSRESSRELHAPTTCPPGGGGSANLMLNSTNTLPPPAMLPPPASPSVRHADGSINRAAVLELIEQRRGRAEYLAKRAETTATLSNSTILTSSVSPCKGIPVLQTSTSMARLASSTSSLGSVASASSSGSSRSDGVPTSHTGHETFQTHMTIPVD